MKPQEEQAHRPLMAGETLHDHPAPLQGTGFADAAAQASRLAFLQSLAASLPAVVWCTDRDLRILSSQGSGLARLGVNPGEVVGHSLYTCLQTSDPESPPIAAHLRALRAQSVQLQVQWQGHTFQALVEPLRSPQGEVEGCLGIALDLTEGARVEQSLAAWGRFTAMHAEVSAALTSNAPTTVALQSCVETLARHLGAACARIWTLNPQAQLLDLQASAGCATRLDDRSNRLPVGESLVGCVAQSGQPSLNNAISNDAPLAERDWILREGLVAFAGYPLVVEGCCLGVLALFARRKLTAEVLEGLGSVAGTLAQFVERRRGQEVLAHREEWLRQAQKLEVIGRLTGGVVHDLNNLLTPILGYSDMLLPRFPPGDVVREGLEEIRKSGERVASLAHQLLAFSRKRAVQPQALDLNAAVADMARLLRRLLGEEVELVTVPGPGLWRALGDPGQLDQVILNLASNARDAMPQGGRLTIETRNVELQEADVCRQLQGRPGPHVLLAVSDTGCGMDEITRAHLFEPFFSTKGEYGTGLGLVTVHDIVRQCGGHLEVDTRPGVGTTFRVYLLRAEPDVEPAVDEAHAAPPCRATVLLVEDEVAVRAVTRQMFAACGCAVLEAGDGEEALQVASQYPGAIDLLATDVVLPKRSGPETAARLLLLRPGLRVMYFSGHAEDILTRHGILPQETALLRKPFAPSVLARKVYDLLGS